MVMEVVDEDMDETGMSCTDHPYKNHTPGGICAFCLQDKLGKLVSSSFSSSIFPASATSSISSPSRLPHHDVSTKTNTTNTEKTNKVIGMSNNNTSIIFQRSKSTAVISRRPRNGGGGFWSFLALNRVRAFPQFRQGSLRETRRDDFNNNDEAIEDCYSREGGGEDDERKVSRSRSVGCGSRSFSGDFFERISTGFGDCTLRRVESQREGAKTNNKMTKMKNTPVHAAASSSSAVGGGGGDRVRCGGIFGGFSSSSSSSSSTTNWVSAPTVAAANVQAGRGGGHWRSRSWGWALASPMRVFSRPKRKANANVTPNLNAIPSILSVGG